MRIAAIVLAAGEGRRMGGPKALLRYGDTTFLGHVCRLYRDTVDAVVAVLGAEAERVRSAGDIPTDVAVVVNERWSQGMLSSVWRGLDEAEARGAEAVLLHPVDHPLVASATLAAVRQALVEGALVAVPVWEGRRGHPGGFARSVFAEIRSAPAESGARAVLAADPRRVVAVQGDPGCVTGIDLPEQLVALARTRQPAD